MLVDCCDVGQSQYRWGFPKSKCAFFLGGVPIIGIIVRGVYRGTSILENYQVLNYLQPDSQLLYLRLARNAGRDLSSNCPHKNNPPQ